MQTSAKSDNRAICRLAGSPSLQNLPPELLLRVCSYLSLHCQSSLFSCSKILHEQWKLHVPEDDEAWQFVSWGIDVLARMTSEGCSKDISSTSLHAARPDVKGLPAKISCQHAEQSFVLQVSRWVDPELQMAVQASWPACTKEALWHRLSNSPTTLEFADMMLAPRVLQPLADTKRFAQHFMCLLRDHTGFVWFHMPPGDDPTAPGGLSIRNWNSSWDIDGVRCIQIPPELNISRLTGRICTLYAKLYSPGMEELEPVTQTAVVNCQFDPYDDVKQGFAYEGNVDIDAWIAQH
ncbi:TPA: hypothetical protein ACH3X3_006738 [Trebouxia sp. C0006]